ncbi:MAG: hypothetical protein ACRET7_07145 [Burkholderiales bacterium]
MTVPGYDETTNASFDVGIVTGGRFYFTDRNNAAVQVYDAATNAFVGSIKGFSGCNVGGFLCAGKGFSNSRVGPNSISAITGTKLLFVSDVDAVRVVDTATSPGTIVRTISFGTTGADAGIRADAGCFNADDKLYMVSTEAKPPFITFISAASQQIVAKITVNGGRFDGAGGTETCQYDSATKNFYVNSSGTKANPRGELTVIPANRITPFLAAPMAAGTSQTLDSLGPTVLSYPLPRCSPTGLALGPGTDIAVGCRPGTAGDPLTVLIMNRTNGAIVATVNAGGGDHLQYDAATNRYYNSSSRWRASGINDLGGACSEKHPCTPVLNIVDAASRTVVARLPAGNNAHTVAVDGVNKKVFMPFSSPDAPAGCATCRDNKFLTAGVAVYAME